MANTVVLLFMTTGRADWELRLTAQGAATVLNNSPDGDTLVEGAPGQYAITVDEALAGTYEAGLFDDNGDCKGRGVVTLADDVGPYYVEDPRSKTGYKLASDGLDTISTAAPSGLASNFREMLVQVWRRFFKKVVRDANAGTIVTYADDGTTPVTSQSYTTSGTDEDETVGGAS